MKCYSVYVSLDLYCQSIYEFVCIVPYHCLVINCVDVNENEKLSTRFTLRCKLWQMNNAFIAVYRLQYTLLWRAEVHIWYWMRHYLHPTVHWHSYVPSMNATCSYLYCDKQLQNPPLQCYNLQTDNKCVCWNLNCSFVLYLQRSKLNELIETFV